MTMVDLSGMLADYAASGAYYIDASGKAALEEAAQRLDFAYASIDLSDCSDKDAVLQRIARTLDFPPWFGGNWDALADCLRDLSWWPAPGYAFLLDHANTWQQQDQVGLEVLLDIGNEVAAEWAEHGVPFWLLIPVQPGQLSPD